MPEVCIVYLSDDEPVIEELVNLLRRSWDVWWARDIGHGHWEKIVRAKIKDSKLLIPVLSNYARGERIDILVDEMRFARSEDVPILPFRIGKNAETPFGFGGLSYTTAIDWTGDARDPGFLELCSRIDSTLGQSDGAGSKVRSDSLVVNRKSLRLPTFVFSLSSYETQVTPNQGAKLLHALGPQNAALVSAYDVVNQRGKHGIVSVSRDIQKSPTVLFLDCGNYEAYRKADFLTEANPLGWSRERFLAATSKVRPDIAFAFDEINPTGSPQQIAAKIARSYRSDVEDIGDDKIALCPVVHLPRRIDGSLAEIAATIAVYVAREVEPVLLAIPERELGDGLHQRVRTVQRIRSALNEIGRYIPLHLLGTGNPLSMLALACAGADSFDGLEWCRTVADYDTGYLFHFQQFDFFSKTRLNRIQDARIKGLIEDPQVSYSARTLSYNIDFFSDWAQTMQKTVPSSGALSLLKSMLPHLGPILERELSAGGTGR